MSSSDDTRNLVLSIVAFLNDELSSRTDLSLEDRESLEIAKECLELAYGVEDETQVLRRPLLDMFQQVSNPASVKAKTEAEALKTSGNSKMTDNQFQEAYHDYTRAIELDRWNAVYYCNRAGARIQLREYMEALSDCRRALSLNPDYAKAYSRMGQAYVLMERFRQAVICYRKAVELEPGNERYRGNLRIAEEQSNQHAPQMGGLLGSVLAALLGMPPQVHNRVPVQGHGPGQFQGSSGFPAGFMVISGMPNDEDDHTGSSETSNSAENGASGTGTSSDGNSDSNEPVVRMRIIFRAPDQEEGTAEGQTGGPDLCQCQGQPGSQDQAGKQFQLFGQGQPGGQVSGGNPNGVSCQGQGASQGQVEGQGQNTGQIRTETGAVDTKNDAKNELTSDSGNEKSNPANSSGSAEVSKGPGNLESKVEETETKKEQQESKSHENNDTSEKDKKKAESERGNTNSENQSKEKTDLR